MAVGGTLKRKEGMAVEVGCPQVIAGVRTNDTDQGNESS